MYGISAAKAEGLHTAYELEYHVMKEMHWGPRDFLDAPPDLIEEIIERISARSKWERKKQDWDEAMAKS